VTSPCLAPIFVVEGRRYSSAMAMAAISELEGVEKLASAVSVRIWRNVPGEAGLCCFMLQLFTPRVWRWRVSYELRFPDQGLPNERCCFSRRRGDGS